MVFKFRDLCVLGKPYGLSYPDHTLPLSLGSLSLPCENAQLYKEEMRDNDDPSQVMLNQQFFKLSICSSKSHDWHSRDQPSTTQI